MSIIEQAARRLEELRRSGIAVPEAVGGPVPAAPVLVPPAAPALTPGPVTAAPERNAANETALPRATLPARNSRRVVIDLERLAAMGYLSPDAPRTQISDEFRVIKRPLLAKVDARPQGAGSRENLIMVTSALPGEGKTFVSVNLAISLALELERTVLLVDADVSRPSVLSRLNLPSSAGLLDILTDPSLGVSDVLLRTNIEKLAILPSGKANARATELLTSEAMARLLHELATRYPDRIVVFDAPPLLPSTESRALAGLMGQVVMVVEADRTSQRSITSALATVEGCANVQILLNKISRSDVIAYGGYYGPN